MLLAGCSSLPGLDDNGPDANESDCHFPDITVGSNAYVVGGVTDENNVPLANVTVHATPSSGGAAIEDTSNDSGCYFLSLKDGEAYTVRATLDGFQSIERRGVVAQSGEKQIIDLRLQSR